MAATILRFPTERIRKTDDTAHPAGLSPSAFLFWPVILGTAMGAATIAAAAEHALVLRPAKDG